MNLPILINNPPNVFNAEIVHRDLEDNRDFWNHAAYLHQTVGIHGQDCQARSTYYYLVVAPGMENQLLQLAARWKPGKVEWANPKERRRFHILKTQHSIRMLKVLKVTWVG